MATNQAAMKIKRLQDVNVKGKRVLLRVDYNVPMKGAHIEDDSRIRESLPTLKHLVDNGAKVALIAHFGRPKGKVDPKYSLKPVVPGVEKVLGKKVAFAPDCVGPDAEKAVSALKPGELVLLENLRFHAGEEGNDPDFAKALSKLGEVFVQDAFGALHRA